MQTGLLIGQSKKERVEITQLIHLDRLIPFLLMLDQIELLRDLVDPMVYGLSRCKAWPIELAEHAKLALALCNHEPGSEMIIDGARLLPIALNHS